MVGISNTPNEEGKQVIRVTFKSIPNTIEIICESQDEARQLYLNLCDELGFPKPGRWIKNHESK